jgi:hypothetical protein
MCMYVYIKGGKSETKSGIVGDFIPLDDPPGLLHLLLYIVDAIRNYYSLNGYCLHLRCIQPACLHLIYAINVTANPTVGLFIHY